MEIQLGRTDEAHIIRTIEYWDIERKRYPQYEHTAVIVAEDITSRFLNVIALFNGSIPLVAIQLNAVKLGDSTISLVFSTVIGEVQLGLVDEDEEVAEITDRAYWEARGCKETVEIADALLGLIRGFKPDFDLKYNKFYIGMAVDGQANNFVVFRPKKKALLMEPRLPRSDVIEEKVEKAGLDTLAYDSRWGRHRIRLVAGDVAKHKDLLIEILKQAYDENA